MSIESAIYGALPSVFHGFRLSGSSSCPMNYFANVTDGADRQWIADFVIIVYII